jgi:hypothetical protein
VISFHSISLFYRVVEEVVATEIEEERTRKLKIMMTGGATTRTQKLAKTKLALMEKKVETKWTVTEKLRTTTQQKRKGEIRREETRRLKMKKIERSRKRGKEKKKREGTKKLNRKEGTRKMKEEKKSEETRMLKRKRKENARIATSRKNKMTISRVTKNAMIGMKDLARKAPRILMKRTNTEEEELSTRTIPMVYLTGVIIALRSIFPLC